MEVGSKATPRASSKKTGKAENDEDKSVLKREVGVKAEEKHSTAFWGLKLFQRGVKQVVNVVDSAVRLPKDVYGAGKMTMGEVGGLMHGAGKIVLPVVAEFVGDMLSIGATGDVMTAEDKAAFRADTAFGVEVGAHKVRKEYVKVTALVDRKVEVLTDKAAAKARNIIYKQAGRLPETLMKVVMGNVVKGIVKELGMKDQINQDVFTEGVLSSIYSEEGSARDDVMKSGRNVAQNFMLKEFSDNPAIKAAFRPFVQKALEGLKM